MTVVARIGIDELAERSVALLLEHQDASGSFVACPTFPVYRYAWFRDGSFCAYALDLAGRREASARFHAWAARAVERRRDRAEAAIAVVAAGGTPAPEQMLPARYTLAGEIEADGEEPWPNFQLDGYGTWLWALARHLDGRPLPDELEPAVRLVAAYLDASWRLPCWSWWEELDGGEHASTLGAVAAGLAAAAELLQEPHYGTTAARAVDRLRLRYVREGHLVREPDDERADGSLLSLGIPFAVVDPDEPLMRATVEAVRAQLVGPTGGVRRYLGDSYYGGGEWVLLTCWLALYDARAGRRAELDRLAAWICERADAGGLLPEQETSAPQVPEMVQEWVERWGPPASPLLWSHATVVVLDAEIRGAAAAQSDLRA